MEYVLLIIGFICLIKGADFFVTGAGSIAKTFNIPDLIIGLTIVAFGTSAPELAVSTVASLGGQNEIAISNILGSNIFNILVVLGICAIINPLKVDNDIFKRDYPFAIMASFLLVIMFNDVFLGISDINMLSRIDGIILLVVFLIFMYMLIKSSLKNSANNVKADEVENNNKSTLYNGVMLVIGLVLVIAGGQLVVDSSTEIALSFGVSETLIGLTIVAIGTSLPELVTSIIACRKGNNDMAIGNVIGSNIFNILFTLALCSAISPIAVSETAIIDAVIALVVTIIALIMSGTKRVISRNEGIVMLMIFVAYNVYIFSR